MVRVRLSWRGVPIRAALVPVAYARVRRDVPCLLSFTRGHRKHGRSLTALTRRPRLI